MNIEIEPALPATTKKAKKPTLHRDIIAKIDVYLALLSNLPEGHPSRRMDDFEGKEKAYAVASTCMLNAFWIGESSEHGIEDFRLEYKTATKLFNALGDIVFQCVCHGGRRTIK